MGWSKASLGGRHGKVIAYSHGDGTPLPLALSKDTSSKGSCKPDVYESETYRLHEKSVKTVDLKKEACDLGVYSSKTSVKSASEYSGWCSSPLDHELGRRFLHRVWVMFGAERILGRCDAHS